MSTVEQLRADLAAAQAETRVAQETAEAACVLVGRVLRLQLGTSDDLDAAIAALRGAR